MSVVLSMSENSFDQWECPLCLRVWTTVEAAIDHVKLHVGVEILSVTISVTRP